MRPQSTPHDSPLSLCRQLGKAHGFTLLELMVTLAIVAILTSIAVPSYLSLTQSNRVATEVNAFIGDLQFARSEAIKQGLPISLCVSADGLNCTAGDVNWNKGWLIFQDANSNASLDANERLLKKQAAWTNTDTFTADSNIAIISYSRDGFAISLPGDVTLKLQTKPVNTQAMRCVVVKITGRHTVQSAGTGKCS